MNEKLKCVDSGKYRRAIYIFLNWKNKYDVLYLITDIKVTKDTNNTIVCITTQKPGLLIGKAGKLIEELKRFIEEDTNENIIIKIKESALWKNMYDDKEK